jgi:hypothetical protein
VFLSSHSLAQDPENEENFGKEREERDMVRVVLMDSAFPALYSLCVANLGRTVLWCMKAVHHVCLFVPVSEIVNILDTLVQLRNDCIVTRAK